MGNFFEHKDLLIPFVAKLTSGKFIFTIVCAGVFAYMSIMGILKEDKVMEIILIVVYAYFNKRSEPVTGGKINDEDDGSADDSPVTTTTTTKR